MTPPARRPYGHASVEEHPKGSGRFRVRARIGGAFKTIVSGVPKSEAEECAAAYAETRVATELREGLTVTAFGLGFLDRRELAGIRGIRTDRNRWKLYLDADPIGGLPISSLGRRDVIEWRDRLLKRKLAAQTVKNALNLLRVALQEALDRDLLTVNPARDVRVPRRASNTTHLELDGVLLPEEQTRLLAVVPKRERHVVEFALYTGLRQAEQWWLQWLSVHDDRVVVRFSVGGKPTKGGKPRVVHLLPQALAAIESARGGSKLWVFPAKEGGRRQQGKKPAGWRRWLRAAGITRRVRWHDLRHTCATSLLAGWWGDTWSLEEVCTYLGHASITTTERYARKVAELQANAVRRTAKAQGHGGGGRSQTVPNAEEVKDVNQQESCGALGESRTPDQRFRKARTSPKRIEVLSLATFPPGNSRSLSAAAWGLVQAAERVLAPQASKSRAA